MRIALLACPVGTPHGAGKRLTSAATSTLRVQGLRPVFGHEPGLAVDLAEQRLSLTTSPSRIHCPCLREGLEPLPVDAEVDLERAFQRVELLRGPPEDAVLASGEGRSVTVASGGLPTAFGLACSPRWSRSRGWRRLSSAFRQRGPPPRDTDLSALLKVSAYAGNVGFDLLVPDLEERTVLQVEVKRVPALDGAAFFLSENERRQALALGSGWRLWLVASDGTSRDVSWIRDELLRSEESVGSLLARGEQGQSST